MGYYVDKFLPEPYILQDDKTFDRQCIKAGQLIVKAEYLGLIKTSKNWYWQQLENKESITISPRTIFHPCLDVSNIKYVADVPRSL